MTEKKTPELVQLFTNLLWVNSPKDWILKSTYFQETLFITVLIEVCGDEKCKKIRRSFDLNVIHSRSEDLSGMANDCIDEIKNNGGAI